MQLNYQDLVKKASELNLLNQAFIDGKYVEAIKGKTFACYSPRDGKLLVDVVSCDSDDVDLAVKAARKAFDSGAWCKQSPFERKKVLLKFADILEQNRLELALLETLDMGKPINNSFHDDVAGAIEKVRWVAECIDKLYDQIAPTQEKIIAMITREPSGVVGCVTPWNFPLYLACAKIIPAIAVGNSVVIKPAEQSPLSTIRIAEFLQQAGVPEGVVNVLPGMGETAGAAIGRHSDIDVCSFTGSTEVGRLFLRYSADSNMKKILLECGGKSPNIIMADCGNLDEVAEAATRVFYNQGEVCTARSRMIVDKKIQDKLMEKFIKYSADYTPGDPLDPQTKMGAMVDDVQTDRVMQYIQLGQQEGAKLIKGGQQTKQDSGGYYIEPTVFTDVKNSMRIAQEEIFGPVATVMSFSYLDEAVKLANETTYGLAATLWTQDINKAFLTAKALRAGSVSVNAPSGGSPATPFGGYKQSGIGREGSLQDFDNYSETKTTWVKLS